MNQVVFACSELFTTGGIQRFNRNLLDAWTELGTGGNPGDAALVDCAEVMASECGWDTTKTKKELDEVRAAFPTHSMVTI